MQEIFCSQRWKWLCLSSHCKKNTWYANCLNDFDIIWTSVFFIICFYMYENTKFICYWRWLTSFSKKIAFFIKHYSTPKHLTCDLLSKPTEAFRNSNMWPAYDIQGIYALIKVHQINVTYHLLPYRWFKKRRLRRSCAKTQQRSETGKARTRFRLSTTFASTSAVFSRPSMTCTKRARN